MEETVEERKKKVWNAKRVTGDESQRPGMNTRVEEEETETETERETGEKSWVEIQEKDNIYWEKLRKEKYGKNPREKKKIFLKYRRRVENVSEWYIGEWR